ncbi:MAG: hypothetical protein AAF292_12925 [Pseudomonadota bacterium]
MEIILMPWVLYGFAYLSQCFWRKWYLLLPAGGGGLFVWLLFMVMVAEIDGPGVLWALAPAGGLMLGLVVGFLVSAVSLTIQSRSWSKKVEAVLVLGGLVSMPLVSFAIRILS